MPEVQAINQLAETLQNSILATMAIVTLSVILMMFWMIRAANAQDKRQQHTVQTVLTMQGKALDTKEQIDRLADGQDSAVVVLQNHQGALNTLSSLIKQSHELLKVLQAAHEQEAVLNQKIVDTMVDIFSEQEGINDRLGTMNEQIETAQDANMRLIVLLERLNVNLETFNDSIKVFNAHMETIKSAVLSEVHSEPPSIQPVELPDTDKGSDDA